DDAAIRARVEELLSAMTLAEKAGQLTQYFSFGLHEDDATVGEVPQRPGEVDDASARGGAGPLLFVTARAETNRLQRLAVEGSRHGIPVLFGFDVIHGLRTIFPVPIGLAASWDPETIDRGPRGPCGRHPLDVRADGRHRPRPSVGTDRRGRRRGPLPRCCGGRGSGAR